MLLLPLVPLAILSSVLAAPSSYVGVNTPSVAAWYPAWLGNNWPPSKISWSKYTTMKFAFVLTTPDVRTLAMDDASESVLPDFIDLAKKNNVKAIATVGGWTGSQYFSSAVATAENRTAFVKTIVDFATKYKFDGIDFDWEYPTGSGLECNIASVNDSANFLAFLQALRNDPVGKNLIITAGVGITPFKGSDGNPLASVSGFADVFDSITIMGYDFYGPWSSTAGPNAPLFDTCAPPAQQVGSIDGAIKAWTSAGFPAAKLSLGVPAYGHSFIVNSSLALDASGQMNLYPPNGGTPNGDKWDSAPGVDQCGTMINRPGGIFNFWGLMEAGFLKSNGHPVKNIISLYDECTQTPYVYNKTSQVMVSYDNTKSMTAKGNFAQKNGLEGVTMWTVAGDYNDLLINSVRKGLRI